MSETHISWVLLTGDTAYKVMKPLRTDVVDQGDVDARRAACERELELNARLAPDVYRGVGAITLYGAELEPVIVMRRMPEDRRLTALLPGSTARQALRDVVRRMATFHAATPTADPVTAEMLAGVDALRRRWRDDLDGPRATTDAPGVLALTDEHHPVRWLTFMSRGGRWCGPRSRPCVTGRTRPAATTSPTCSGWRSTTSAGRRCAWSWSVGSPGQARAPWHAASPTTSASSCSAPTGSHELLRYPGSEAPGWP